MAKQDEDKTGGYVRCGVRWHILRPDGEKTYCNITAARGWSDVHRYQNEVCAQCYREREAERG